MIKNLKYFQWMIMVWALFKIVYQLIRITFLTSRNKVGRGTCIMIICFPYLSDSIIFGVGVHII